MSDSDESTVTYTEVSSPFEGLSDIGSPGVVGPEHEGLPWMLDAYFVPELVYPEYMSQEDEVFLAEEQPLPDATSPTAQSHQNNVLRVPTDGGDDGDDEDESLEDDEDDDVDIEADDEEEEEEHPALADSTAVALSATDQAPSAKETESFETDESVATPPPHPAYRVTARISIRDETPISLPPREEIPSPPLPSILSPLPVSPPYTDSPPPPLPVSSPVPMLSSSPPASLIRPLGYRAAMIRLRAEAASTSHSLPLPPPIILSHTRPDAPSSEIPPLHLLSTDRRADRPEVTLPPWKRLGIALGPGTNREIRRDLERDVGYGITDSWDEIVEAMQETPVVTDVAELSKRMMSRLSDIYWLVGLTYCLGIGVHMYHSVSSTVSDYRATGSRPQETGGDYRDAGGRPQQGPAKGPAQPDAPEEAGSSS
ncbi:hypothetical protein Tco_0909374 [Tanacetum coccineum]|uniref:Uncharacterized protein n=1 Tax=Tanacetum coccineum TaxID=301880 RepID=A0ABQ5CW39_9ASTR